MRAFIITVLIALISIPVSAQRDHFIETGKAGMVIVGMTVDELYGHFNQDSVHLFDQFLEGTYSPALNINEGELIAEIECGKIWRVKVRSAVYRTKEGLGVGSNLKELLDAYPKATFLRGEGNFVIYVSDLHLSFSLSQDVLEDGKFYDELSDLPPEMAVAEILVLPK